MLTPPINLLGPGLAQSFRQPIPLAQPTEPRTDPLSDAPQRGGSLSPRASELGTTPGISGGKGAGARGPASALINSAQGLIHKALNDMRRDIGGMLANFGVAPDLAQEVGRAFTDPVLAALKSGADFNATISLVAAQQQTVVSGSGMSQSLALVAKSLEISVNHTTGEVSVRVASVSIESRAEVNFGRFGPQPADFQGFPTAVDSLIDRMATALDLLRGITQAAEAEDDDGEILVRKLPIDLAALAGPNGGAPRPPAAVARAAAGFDTTFHVNAIEHFQNTLGEFITKIRLDAALALDSKPGDAQSAGEAEPDDPDRVDVSI